MRRASRMARAAATPSLSASTPWGRPERMLRSPTACEGIISSHTQETLCQNSAPADWYRSEEHTSELQSLMRISYAVFCLKKKKNIQYSHPYDKLHHKSADLSENKTNA